MKDRIEAEIALLRRVYPSLVHGEALDWVMVPDYLLPPASYNRTSTRLLVLLPSIYPQSPPDNFYVDVGLRAADGSGLNNYSEGGGVPIPGSWGNFSWHSDGEWKPGVTPETGDNLTTFFRSVNIRLREGK